MSKTKINKDEPSNEDDGVVSQFGVYNQGDDLVLGMEFGDKVKGRSINDFERNEYMLVLPFSKKKGVILFDGYEEGSATSLNPIIISLHGKQGYLQGGVSQKDVWVSGVLTSYLGLKVNIQDPSLQLLAAVNSSTGFTTDRYCSNHSDFVVVAVDIDDLKRFPVFNAHQGNPGGQDKKVPIAVKANNFDDSTLISTNDKKVVFDGYPILESLVNYLVLPSLEKALREPGINGNPVDLNSTDDFSKHFRVAVDEWNNV